jgi:hypothetical protein
MKVMDSPTIIVELTTSLFYSASFHFICYEALLSGADMFIIIAKPLGRLTLLISIC